MLTMQSRIRLLVMVVALSLIPHKAIAQNQVSQRSTSKDFESLIEKSRTFTMLDDGVFGDAINLQDGAVSFIQNDISLPTNSGLTVSLGRKSSTLEYYPDKVFPVFGPQWELDVPFITGTFDTRTGWREKGYGEGIPDGKRCSSGDFTPKETNGPWPYYYSQIIYAYMWWKGNNINIPGKGSELLLNTNASQINPTDGKTYFGTTKSNWRIACLPTIKNGFGEGFTATLPDGTVYYFDWMAQRNSEDLTDNGGYTDANGDGTEPWHTLVPLTHFYLYATKVVDRYGNTLTYTYDATYPNRISSVVSSDGVRLDVQYNANGRISTVTSGSRTWKYTYTAAAVPDQSLLESFVLPDNTKWQYSGSFQFYTPVIMNYWEDACAQNKTFADNPFAPPVVTTTIIHPSGARVDFAYLQRLSGINNAPGGCTVFGTSMTDMSFGTYGVPNVYGVLALKSKTISAPGAMPKLWSYGYQTTKSFASSCSPTCPSSTQETYITEPNGNTKTLTFGNNFSTNYGQLLSESIKTNGGIVVKTTTNTYLTSSVGRLFPNDVGTIPTGSGNGP